MAVNTEFLRLYLTVLCETLKEGSNNHDQRTQHDGPSSSVAMSEPRREWNTKDRAKLIRRVDEAEQAWLNGKIAIFVRAPIAKVYSQVSTNSKRLPSHRLDLIDRDLTQLMGPSFVDKSGVFRPLSVVEEQGSFNPIFNACYYETRSV